ncbi:MAG: glycosyltransferase [Lachnospiraceae bacterium]|nr:glycosyltransferase [Lachnospiraceae bacterium]
MKISVIVVTLNAGDELKATVKSIVTQTYRDLEIIVKDGRSSDGSLKKLPDDERIRVVSRPDKGIYDAMNQALEEVSGDYVLFLNCGDYLYDEHAIETAVSYIDGPGLLVYGDIFDRSSGARVASNPVIDEFALYRNVPCHQACIYDRNMLLMHPFKTEYKVRADYEQFLWCYYIAKAKFVYTGSILSSYMGGGFSEQKENRKISAAEHTDIAENYMPHKQIVKYRRRMIMTMAPLRRVIAGNPVTGGIYNRIKSAIYKKKLSDS